MAKHIVPKTWDRSSTPTGPWSSVPPAVPVNTVAPTITGTKTVGSTLTASHGTWSGSPTAYAYQWYRCATFSGTYAAIGGATASTYVPVAGDEGYYLKAGVVATNAGGSSVEALSSATSAIGATGSLPIADISWITYKGKFSKPTYGHSTVHDTSTQMDTSRPLGVGSGGTTLYYTAHRGDYKMFHLNIPAIGGTATIATDAVDMGMDAANTPGIGNNAPPISALVYNGRLIVANYIYYDGSNAGVYSHQTATLSMGSKSDAMALRWADDTTYGYTGAGPANAYFYAGKMCNIPSEWQASLGGTVLTAQGMASIVTRTPEGLALYAFDPDDLGSGTLGTLANPVSAQALAIQPHWAPYQTHIGEIGYHCDDFQVGDQVTAVAFIPGTRSIWMIGPHGDGTYDYGPGTTDTSKASVVWGEVRVPYPDPVTGPHHWCYDECNGDEGTHAWPVIYRVWVADATQLAEVKAGTRLPEDVTYSWFNFDNIPAHSSWGGGPYVRSACFDTEFGGTFDDANGLLYIMDGGYVHVFQIEEPA